MNYIKVKSIEHLKKLLDNGENEFVVAVGAFRSSKFITANDEFVYIMHYCDSSEERLLWEHVCDHDSYISEKIIAGQLYCETEKTYEQ